MSKDHYQFRCEAEFRQPKTPSDMDACVGLGYSGSKLTDEDRRFLEEARFYTAKRGFSVIEKLVEIIDRISK